MADQAITPTALTPDTVSAAIAPTALTAANDGVITPVTDNMVIVLTDTGAAGGTVLVKAGASALASGQGDITVTLGANETKIVTVSSARVKAMSGGDIGKIRLDATANTNASAYTLP